MAYYNPSSWIASDDQLVDSIEHKIRLYKRARPRTSRPGKAFTPPNSMELSVVIRETNEMLRLTEWIDPVGKISIELTDDGTILRQGHFNHGWHHNPNGVDIPPPNHIHFPTVKHRDLTRHPAYAYRVKSASNYIEALAKYCSHSNIDIEGAAIPWLPGRVV